MMVLVSMPNLQLKYIGNVGEESSVPKVPVVLVQVVEHSTAHQLEV